MSKIEKYSDLTLGKIMGTIDKAGGIQRIKEFFDGKLVLVDSSKHELVPDFPLDPSNVSSSKYNFCVEGIDVLKLINRLGGPNGALKFREGKLILVEIESAKSYITGKPSE
jgi:hypothetical protein